MSKNSLNQYDTIVIGAGIGGLTCGATLAKNGLNTLILEQDSRPGGYCTSFKRKGFIFDSAVHYIQGAGNNGFVHQILKSLDIDTKIEFRRMDPLYRLVLPDESIVVPADLNEYINLLSKKFPSESKGIFDLFSTIRKLMAEMPRVPEKFNIWDLASFPFKFPLLYKYNRKTFEEMMSDFITDGRLKSIIAGNWLCLGLPPSKISALLMSAFIYSAHILGHYYPIGGTQGFADILAQAFMQYHGSLRCKSKVSKILIEDGSVTGVETSEGEKISAKAVISNADARLTFNSLIEPINLSRKFLDRVNTMELSMSCALAWLGIDFDPRTVGANESEVIYYSSYDYDEIYKECQNGRFESACLVCLPSFMDPKLAPAGSHIVSVFCLASYDYASQWRTKKGKRGIEYSFLKEEVQNRLTMLAEKVVPGVSKSVIVKECATPITLERYTLNSRGAAYGWANSPAQSSRGRLQPQSPIRGLYLAGHWTTPGTSTAVAAISGRRTAELIIKQN
jgi:prolycopene isomerase